MGGGCSLLWRSDCNERAFESMSPHELVVCHFCDCGQSATRVGDGEVFTFIDHFTDSKFPVEVSIARDCIKRKKNWSGQIINIHCSQRLECSMRDF